MLQDHWAPLGKKHEIYGKLKRWDHEISFKCDSAKQDRQRHTQKAERENHKHSGVKIIKYETPTLTKYQTT